MRQDVALCLSLMGNFILKQKCFMDKAVLVLGEGRRGGGMVEEGGGPDHSKTASDGPDLPVWKYALCSYHPESVALAFAHIKHT